MNVLLKEQPVSPRAETALRLPSLDRKEVARTLLSLHAAEDFPEILNIPSYEGKKEFLDKRLRDLSRKIETDQRSRKFAQDRLDFLKGLDAAFVGVISWVDSGISIEKPQGTKFREMRKAISRDENLWYYEKDVKARDASESFEREIFRSAEAFVIEHDWASAFSNSDMADADFKLPYDVCAFEFQFTGRAVIALAVQLETSIYFCPAISCPQGWILPDFSIRISAGSRSPNEKFDDLFGKIGEQIRAVCIALEAEVARSEVVREPHLSEGGRNTFSPKRGYHIVSLAHRTARPLAIAEPGSTGRRVRLHFRRGHWRHFETHKTWIKWMLVGDPDLGFVEKHYRL